MAVATNLGSPQRPRRRDNRARPRPRRGIGFGDDAPEERLDCLGDKAGKVFAADRVARLIVVGHLVSSGCGSLRSLRGTASNIGAAGFSGPAAVRGLHRRRAWAQPQQILGPLRLRRRKLGVSRRAAHGATPPALRLLHTTRVSGLLSVTRRRYAFCLQAALQNLVSVRAGMNVLQQTSQSPAFSTLLGPGSRSPGGPGFVAAGFAAKNPRQLPCGHGRVNRTTTASAGTRAFEIAPSIGCALLAVWSEGITRPEKPSDHSPVSPDRLSRGEFPATFGAVPSILGSVTDIHATLYDAIIIRNAAG